MIDLGVDPEIIQSELQKLDLSGYQIDVRTEKRCAIAGIYIDIKIDAKQPARTWRSMPRTT